MLPLAAGDLMAWLGWTGMLLKVVLGFSIIIFVHELGHFLAAKYVDVRVDRFAIGFGYRLFGYRRGEGFTFGKRPEYTAEQLREHGYGETDYCVNALMFGGYVRMLGQDDFVIDDKTEEIKVGNDPRAFPNRSVGARMLIASAGVIFNVIFAFLLLIAVFMIGLKQEEPVVGEVLYDSPAMGKLFPGDQILEIDRTPVRTFRDVIRKIVFSEGDVRLKIERGGKVLPNEIVVTPELNDQTGLRMINVTPPYNTEVGQDLPPVGDRPRVLAGDRIVQVGASPAFSIIELSAAVGRSNGAPIEVMVERSGPQDPNQKVQATAYLQGALLLSQAEISNVGDFPATDTTHLLGFVPRRALYGIRPDTPAGEAGLKDGDVVLQWGSIANPRFSEMIDLIRANKYTPITVRVQRAGKEVALTVTPRPAHMWGDTAPKIGAGISNVGAEGEPIIADVVPQTPAAGLSFPRGARLTEIDGHPVSTWREVVDGLLMAAGRTVTIKARSGADDISGALPVPHSVADITGIPTWAHITKVDGAEDAAAPTGKADQRVRVATDLGLREALRAKIGQTVDLEYVTDPKLQAQHVRFAVTAENFDPWPMRVQYVLPLSDLNLEPKLIPVKAANPFEAISMGVGVMLNNLSDIYAVGKQMVTRRVGMQSVAGPVGIVDTAMKQAKAGLADLLFFLSFLSINLASLNFLPIPVLDGGLMVFLIIEKLKGKPLSFKAQMISTMVGLAAILLMVAFATFQDVSRFFQ